MQIFSSRCCLSQRAQRMRKRNPNITIFLIFSNFLNFWTLSSVIGSRDCSPNSYIFTNLNNQLQRCINILKFESMSSRSNEINKDCVFHRKQCEYFCTQVTCPIGKILCERCIPSHLQHHQKQFIYHISNINEIHGFDKLSTMKEILVHNKTSNLERIDTFYEKYCDILNPLNQRLQKFEDESKGLIHEELVKYLRKNKSIIESTHIKKSDPVKLKRKPEKMLDEMYEEMAIINEKEMLMKENSDQFGWYLDASDELNQSLIQELQSMVNVAIKLIDNYYHIQESYFDENAMNGREDHHDKSFYKRYFNSHRVADKGEKNSLELALVNNKKQIEKKDEDIKNAHKQIKSKVKKIEELNSKIDGLKEQLIQWEQKLEKEEKEKLEAVGREKKKKEEFLITNDIIIDDGKSVSLEKKVIDDKYVQLIFQLVPSPVQLILTSHQLSPSQLKSFLHYSSIQIFRMSFMKCNKQFLIEAFQKFQNLHTVELNSAGIDNQTLGELGSKLCSKVRHVYIMDNKISDDGLEALFRNMRHPLESLYVSYNQLTSRSIEVINSYSYEIKVLHISKNPIKTKGGSLIGKYLKELEELFVGGTGIQKEGFLSICRNCLKMQRMSLVATEISTDIVSQILLVLQNMVWLDLSYSTLNKDDLSKIEKLKIFNKGIEIISEL